MASFASYKAAAEPGWLDEEVADLVTDEAHSSTHLLAFVFSLQDLCVPKSSANGAESKELRKTAWQALDFNNNGIVSLAETGKWIQERLINFFCDKDNAAFGIDKSSAVLLYKRFYPCFIRAFLDAADYGAATKVTQKGGGKSYSNTETTTDDYVQYKEFRLLVTYLAIYACIYEAFGNLDGGGKGIDATDDRRISLDEWKTHAATLKGHPLDSLAFTAIQDPEKSFAAMDADGKGKVLLSEFSTYIEDFEFSLGSRWGKLLNAGEAVKESAGAAVAAASAE